MLRELFEQLCMRIPPVQRTDVEQLLRRIGREYTHGDTYSPQLLRQYVSELLILLMRLLESGRGIPATGHSDTLAERVAAYICAHYSEPLTLARVAREFSVSREYFSHRFKKVTGFGFNDSNYFATVFKRVKGMSPKKYQMQA